MRLSDIVSIVTSPAIGQLMFPERYGPFVLTEPKMVTATYWQLVLPDAAISDARRDAFGALARVAGAHVFGTSDALIASFDAEAEARALAATAKRRGFRARLRRYRTTRSA